MCEREEEREREGVCVYVCTKEGAKKSACLCTHVCV